MKRPIENNTAIPSGTDADARAILKLAQIQSESMEAARDTSAAGSATDILDVQDILSDASQIANLVMMAIESLVPDNELRSISAGVYRVLNQIETATTALTKIAGDMRFGGGGIRAEPFSDPLIKAIKHFNDGCREFNVYDPIDSEDENRKFAELIGDRMEALANWTQPANTLEGAIAAIEFWREEDKHTEMSNGSRAMLLAALGYLKAQHLITSPNPWHLAEHHARGLAKAMAAMPEMMQFQITIVPHDADQQLAWVPMTDPEQEIENLQACMDTHRRAIARVAAVADPADAPEEETQAADDAEAAAFSELLKFPCQTAAAKARKTEYLVKHLGKNRFSLELDIDQLETLLESMI